MPPLLLLLFCFLSESISRYCLTHPPSPLLLTLSSSSRPAHFSVPFLPLSSFFIFFYFFHLLLNKTLPAPHPQKRDSLQRFSPQLQRRGENNISYCYHKRWKNKSLVSFLRNGFRFRYCCRLQSSTGRKQANRTSLISE